MFVRKKKNKSGSTSVVVIDKSNGKFKELKTIGISRDENEITELYRSGKKWVQDNYGEPDMFAIYDREQEEFQFQLLLQFGLCQNLAQKFLLLSRCCQSSNKQNSCNAICQIHALPRFSPPA